MCVCVCVCFSREGGSLSKGAVFLQGFDGGSKLPTSESAGYNYYYNNKGYYQRKSITALSVLQSNGGWGREY